MEPTRWSIDPATATVTFVATSSVHPIRSSGGSHGWFEAAVSDGEFETATAVRGRLEIPLDGLSSGNPLVDREMRRRVDAYPVIIAEIDTTVESGGSVATVTGTIRFLNEEVLVEGELNLVTGPRLVGVGEFDVRWWGLEPPRLLMLRVDPIVTVEIDLPLTP